MARSWIFVLPVCASVALACANPNPEFDPNAASGSEGTTELTDSAEGASASASDSAEGASASDSQSSDTDTAESDATTDSSTDSDATDSETETETGEQACEPALMQPLRPFVGTPAVFGQQCPPAIEGLTVLVDGSTGGNWNAHLCNGGCGIECVLELDVGIGAGHPGLDTFLPPGTPEEPLCYTIQAEPLLESDADCVYGSMTIEGQVAQGEGQVIRFHANREGYGPTHPLWPFQAGGWEPFDVVPELGEECLCEEELELPCCIGEYVVPHKFVLDEGETSFASAGQYGTPFNLPNIGTFLFYAAQAQTGGICNQEEPETSWALLRQL